MILGVEFRQIAPGHQIFLGGVRACKRTVKRGSDSDRAWVSHSSIWTSRLEAIPTLTQGQRRSAFELIKRARLAEAMGLPPKLSWESFEQPFKGVRPPVLYLLRGRDGDQFLGVVILWKPSADGWPLIHYGLAPEFQRMGYAREGVGAVVSHLLRKGRIPGVAASILSTNQRSIRLAQAIGMAPLAPGDPWTMYGISKADMKSLDSAALTSRALATEVFLRQAVYRLAAYGWTVPYVRRMIRFVLMDVLPRI